MTHDPDDMECMCGLCWNPTPEPSAADRIYEEGLADAGYLVDKAPEPSAEAWDGKECTCGLGHRSDNCIYTEPSAEADAALYEAAVAVCQLWFTDNAPDGSQHVRKAMLDLRAALSRPTTPLDVERLRLVYDPDHDDRSFIDGWNAALDALAIPTPEPEG